MKLEFCRDFGDGRVVRNMKYKGFDEFMLNMKVS